jgi:hypothetical protein
MILIEILALFLSGTFFGAAVYISIAQHPATMQTGIPFASAFFPPMYGLAAPMQIISALGGTLAGAAMWFYNGNILWLVGAILLIFVVPFTIFILKPINDQLLDTESVRSEAEKEKLLKLWAPRHWVRSIVSGLYFVTYLWASVAI